MRPWEHYQLHSQKDSRTLLDVMLHAIRQPSLAAGKGADLSVEGDMTVPVSRNLDLRDLISQQGDLYTCVGRASRICIASGAYVALNSHRETLCAALAVIATTSRAWVWMKQAIVVVLNHSTRFSQCWTSTRARDRTNWTCSSLLSFEEAWIQIHLFLKLLPPLLETLQRYDVVVATACET